MLLPAVLLPGCGEPAPAGGILERIRARLSFLVPLTLLLVIGILYLNFRGLTQALLVMTSVPFALVGAVWWMWALGYNTSIAAYVGMIALVGVALALLVSLAFLTLRDASSLRAELRQMGQAQEGLRLDVQRGREASLVGLSQVTQSLQGQLEKDGLTMSESDRRNKEQELGRQTREFQRLQREFREDLNLRRNEELAALFERANRVIKQIAESEKFDLILQEAVYRSPRIDITERVLKALSADK